MHGLDRNTALATCFALLRRDWPLTLTLAGIFFFLPTCAFALSVPLSVPVASDASLTEQLTAISALVQKFWPMFIIVGLLQAVGAVAVILLWFQPAGTTVLDGLRTTCALVPVVMLAYVLQTLAVFAGLALLFIPGFIVLVRLCLIAPVLAARPDLSARDALAESWRITHGHGWRIFVLQIIAGFLTIAIGSVVGLFDGAGTGAAPATGGVWFGLRQGVLAVCNSMLSCALVAAIYQQLAVPQARAFNS